MLHAGALCLSLTVFPYIAIIFGDRASDSAVESAIDDFDSDPNVLEVDN